MEKYGFVYIWRDRKHNRYYIGSHWGTEDDGYVCSSPWLMQAYKKRPQDFKRKIIKRVYSTRMNLLNEEFKWLSLIKQHEIKIRYYNLNIKSTGHWTAYPENVKTIQEKISIKTKEAMQKPEVRQKYEEGLKTRNCRSSDLEVRTKRSASMKGKNRGSLNKLESLSKAWEANRGKSLSQDHKDKIKSAGIFTQINNKRVTCIVCGFEGNPGNIGRYHNNKCKKSIN